MDRNAINKKIDEYINDYHDKQQSKKDNLKRKILSNKNSDSSIKRAAFVPQNQRKLEGISNQMNFDLPFEEDPAYKASINQDHKVQKLERKLSKQEESERAKKELALFNEFKKAVTEKAKSSRDNLNNSSEIIPKDAKDNFSLDDMSNPELRELLNKSEDNANNLNQSKHN